MRATLLETTERYAPWLLVLAGIALVARGLGSVLPYATPLILAVTLGLVVGNALSIPRWVEPGADTHKLWLEAGIVLMGARISIGTVLGVGLELLAVTLSGVLVTILVVETLSRTVFGIKGKLGSLLAAGAGICGVSAVVAVAGSIRADERHVAYAAGTVLLFDVVTLFAYPVVGASLGLTDRVFGIWAGITMFSTGPVTAAGFTVSETAGEWATVTKVTRNLLLGLLVGGYSLVYADTAEDFSVRTLWDSLPTFVLGFVALIVLTSTSFVSPRATQELTNAYRWLFLLAFAGLGLEIDIGELRATGIEPVVIVSAALLVASVVTLSVLGLVFSA
ncbi:YeiH family protein [Haloarcula halophila]|uniref:YeiH family protein n=1 Tax=Haloarcula TaxID=2237 RepID=UPI0023E4028F|nr:putative sulfate exporter family transporter [Halomicroarcula sp. DFY41]